jgi:hypothetical protein
MRRLVFALLFGLVLVPLPVHAQSVTLSVCNAGKVDIDVLLSQAGNIHGSHIGPSDCATVAETKGAAMESHYVGFAFVDAKGQWGAARRFDSDRLDGFTRATQNAEVRRGNANVTVPMQWLFSPRAPGCFTTSGRSPAGNFREYATFCDELRYTVNVEAYPDTREIAFLQDCDPCDQKANPQLTPRERAIKQSQREAARIRDARVSTASPNEMGILNRNMTVVDVEEVGQRLERLKPPQPTTWRDLLLGLRIVRLTRHQIWDVIPRKVVIRGTVSGVDVIQDPSDPKNQWVSVAFRESPPLTDPRFENSRQYSEFNVCTTRPDVFQDVFGADFRAGMIGKTIEVQGETRGGGSNTCRGLLGSIEIALAHHVRPVQSTRFDQASASEEADFLRNPIDAFLTQSFADFSPAWIGKGLLGTGKVSRVETKDGYVSLYFEGAGDQFVVCLPESTEGLQFGNNGPSVMVGLTVRAAGIVRPPQRCTGKAAQMESGVELLTRTTEYIGWLGQGSLFVTPQSQPSSPPRSAATPVTPAGAGAASARPIPTPPANSKPAPAPAASVAVPRPPAAPVTPAPAVVTPDKSAAIARSAPAPRAGALSIANFTAQWVGKPVVATGTVARVETIGGFDHLYFQGAGEQFVVCFAQGSGGTKNASELIGRTVEVSGRIDSPVACFDHRVGTVGAVELRQPSQLRLLGNAPGQQRPPSSPPAPAVSPTPAPDNSAAARAKALQEQQERAAQERAATQKRLAQEAQERNQKAQACMQQLLKTYPDGGRGDPAGFQKGLLACAQAEQPEPAK